MDLCFTQAEFILRAMQSRIQAKQANEYYPADFVLNELQTMLSNEFSNTTVLANRKFYAYNS